MVNPKESTPGPKKADYSTNQLVLYILAILTVGEYILGAIATTGIAALMMFIALLKAYFIIKDYMNIGRLFAGDEEGHS